MARWARSIWNRFIEWFSDRELSENAILLVFAVAIGVLSALGVVAFYRGIDLAYAVFYRWPEGVMTRVGVLAYRPAVTGAGTGVAWGIMRRMARGTDGMNVPDIQLAIVRRGGYVPARPAVARTIASAVTIGCGGSAGRGGPGVVVRGG